MGFERCAASALASELQSPAWAMHEVVLHSQILGHCHCEQQCGLSFSCNHSLCLYRLKAQLFFIGHVFVLCQGPWFARLGGWRRCLYRRRVRVLLHQTLEEAVPPTHCSDFLQVRPAVDLSSKWWLMLPFDIAALS